MPLFADRRRCPGRHKGSTAARTCGRQALAVNRSRAADLWPRCPRRSAAMLDGSAPAVHICRVMTTTRLTIDHRAGNPPGTPGGSQRADFARHPEKAHRPDNPIQRKPAWIRVKAPTHPVYHQTRSVIRDHGLVTVCEEAACPNIGECWSQRHATMMIMGDTCTRACSFCNVRTGQPNALAADEP